MNISVVIPAFNCERSLPQCLESVASQTLPPLEILVIDDGSTDRTSEVAQPFKGVRIINRQQQGGAGAARATGVKNAKGDLIAFIDSDCFAPKDWLMKLSQELENDPELGAIGGAYRHCDVDDLVSMFGKFEEEYLHDYFSNEPYTSPLTGGNLAVRKDIWNAARSGRELIHFKNVASSEDTVVSNEIRSMSKTKFEHSIFVRHAPKSSYAGLVKRNITRARTRMLSKLYRLSRGGDNLFNAFGGFRLFWSAIALWTSLFVLLSIVVYPFYPFYQGIVFGILICLHCLLGARYFAFVKNNSERPCPVTVRLSANVGLRLLVAVRAACWTIGTLYGVAQFSSDRLSYYGQILASILHFWRPGKISKMFYFVTSKCNARCEFCFNLENVVNWQERQPLELTLAEIKKMANNFGRLPYVTFSGGEPFARVDIAEVVKAFYDNSRTMWVTIPTNGALTKRVIEGVSEMLITCPNLFLTIQFSIDSLNSAHDESRKIKGGFDAMLKTASGLSDLRRGFKNLRVQINTPYDTFNLNDIENIREFCAKNIDYDQQLFYMFREEGELISDKNAYLADDFLEFIQEHDLSEWRERGRDLWGRAVRALQAVTYSDTRRIKLKREFIRKCFATRKFITLYDDGSFSPCEVLEKTKLGNIRDHDFDFYKLKKAMRVDDFYRKEIIDTECNCEWMCAPAINMLYDPATYVQIAQNFYRPGKTKNPRENKDSEGKGMKNDHFSS